MGSEHLDLLVVGSGVAGLSAVVRAEGLRVGIVSKGRLEDSATQWAQGGVAAVLHHEEADRDGDDSPSLHAADTLQAGAGLCDPDAVGVLVVEGPKRVRELAALGAEFDRGHDGRWLLAREGGHSTARVVHAGGAATGAEVERALVAVARSRADRIWEDCFAADLIVEGGRCRGVTVADRSGRALHPIRARQTLLATGGAGQLYPVTTNPVQATGDGLAMALRAGVAVADLEFVQFHPTALHAPVGGRPRVLLSEALRGEGARLRGASGERFVDEMQPRDVVAAAVAEQMRRDGTGHVWLDVSPIGGFEREFPTLASAVRSAGFDPGTDWLPVAPAAHYLCGGVLTDLDGATTLPGLWAAGEVACTGVHGANRLASNSLLEGMVFGARAVEAIFSDKDQADPTGALLPVLAPGRVPASAVPAVRLATPRPRWRPRSHGGPGDDSAVRAGLQRAMFAGAGVTRSGPSLEAATAELDRLAAAGVRTGETANLFEVASAVLAAATARTESRGGHRRSDHPRTDPAGAHRFVQ